MHSIRVFMAFMASPSCAQLIPLSSSTVSRSVGHCEANASHFFSPSVYAHPLKLQSLSLAWRNSCMQFSCLSHSLLKLTSTAGKSPISGCGLPVRLLSSKRADKRDAPAAVNGAAPDDGDWSDDSDGRVGQEADLLIHEDSKVRQLEKRKFSMGVYAEREIPDVRDGLERFHRRILFAMHELGLSSKKPFKTSARVVCEVMGKYYPYGNTAAYNALVEMVQSFSMRWPLINGHGNFGSIDSEVPAALRYTECRLASIAESMLLADLEMDTVDFVHNFDESQKEPAVLPARLPNALLNGASGKALGISTNIPPHNLGELADALCAFISNLNATVEELMKYMPGPDFPTGGQIFGTHGVVDA